MCSPDKRGTVSDPCGVLTPAPNLLKATNFKSMSFSKWRACFRKSRTENLTRIFYNDIIENIKYIGYQNTYFRLDIYELIFCDNLYV